MSRHFTLLAIETSADETSAAVLRVRHGKIHLSSNIIYSQISVHKKTGGIVPEMAARAHIPKILPAVKLAVKNANLTLRELSCIAVTAGPGLITSLMIGVDTAKTLAFVLEKPIIPINHLEGHLLSALPTNHRRPTTDYFPALGLIVSGGHTMLVLVEKVGRYRILGETLDDAAGEAFDKIAKILGLPYPGGPAISRLAKRGNPKAFNFPRPMIGGQNFNFSFAGLKTAVLYFWRERTRNQRSEIRKLKEDVAASIEQAIVDVLVEKTQRAAKKFKVKTILLGGGVAANHKLRQSLKAKLKKEIPTSDLRLPTSDLTTDNAGMIALVAYHHAVAGHFATFSTVQANPNLELQSWN